MFAWTVRACVPLLWLALCGCSTMGPRPTSGPDAVGRATGETTPIIEVVSPAELPTLAEHYRLRLAQLRPEMSLAEFKALFPEAYFIKRQRVRWAERPLDAYELLLRQRYRFANDPQVYVQMSQAWFYFLGTALESWGTPEDWPSAPAPDGTHKVP